MTLWETIADILGAARYTDHAVCLKNDPVIISMYMLGNLTIGISCLFVGATLYFARIIGRSMVRVHAAKRGLCIVFILLCGLSHFIEGITMFSGAWYRLDVIITGIIAAASATTAAFTVVYIMSAPVRIDT